jgi:predicted transcriptional regulator
VATDLQKLISEYCAIEKMDRILRGSAQNNEIELIGLEARKNRRREILLEIAALTSVAKDSAKYASGISWLWPQ